MKTNNIKIKFIPLFAALLLFPSALAPAQEEIEVLMYSSPDIPVSGSSWTLTLLINHSEPKEVEVMAPPLTGAIFLEQVLKSPRLYDPVSGQTINRQNMAAQETFEQWTAMEYRFTFNNPEIISFEAFTVITPRGRVMTEPFELDVQRAQSTTQMRQRRLVWELPAQLKTGESAVIGLRISGWSAGNSLPATEMFMPPVPPGHIVESMPLTPEEKAAGKVLSLRVIPLETGTFSLQRRQFSYGMDVFEIPAVRIPVGAGSRNTEANPAAAPMATASAAAPMATAPVAAPVSRPAALFPPLEPTAGKYARLYGAHQADCVAVYGNAKDLWEKGHYADSLATLRKNERDHKAGALFAAIRREAEQALGFLETNNEKAGKFLLLFREKSRPAVLKETAFRRIPDMTGEEIARFREGQPVLVMEAGAPNREDSENNGSWRRVTTNDSSGISGWVREESIIYY